MNTVNLVERDVTPITFSHSSPAVARGPVLIYSHHAQLLEALGRGEFDDAYRYAAAINPPGVLAPTVSPEIWVTLDLVEAAVRTDRRAEAHLHVRAMHGRNIAALSPRFALLAGASNALATDDDEESARCFAAALSIVGIEKWPFDVARVRLLHGERLRRQRATTEARSQLTAAFDAFESLGSHPWMHRAATELRATAHTRTESSPWTLTAQEREIAELAASGLTNKQIARQLYLSHRTVGAHLYRVFPKLGVTSRAALRDALEAAA